MYAYVCMHTCVCIHALAPDMCYAPTHVLLQVETACLEGFDGMSKLVTKVLGAEAWLRMVSHACDLP